jgi:ubiquinone/menaquinone biosynthesis C-methylase UbiE
MVVRLDLSMARLRMGEPCGAVQADMRALPLKSASVDGLRCQAAMLHVPLADVPGVLSEFGRVVTAIGRLHLTLAEGDGEGWQSDLYDGEPRWFTHHRVDSLGHARRGRIRHTLSATALIAP